MNAVDRIRWLSHVGALPSSTVAMLKVGISLAQHMNASTGRCDPATATIATETGLAPRSVTRALRDLEAAAVLIVERSMGGRYAATNSYALKLPEDPDAAATGLRTAKGKRATASSCWSRKLPCSGRRGT